MRYVNLTKRNTSKSAYVAKKLAISCFTRLLFMAIIVLPFAAFNRDFKVEDNNIMDIQNEEYEDVSLESTYYIDR